MKQRSSLILVIPFCCRVLSPSLALLSHPLFADENEAPQKEEEKRSKN
jgi:hypothetical protein